MRKKLALIPPILIALAIVAVTTQPKARGATPTLSISQHYDMTEPGTTFLVNITISDVTDLQVWMVNLTWDPAIIQVSTGDPNSITPLLGGRYNVYEGPFMKGAMSTHFFVWQIDNTNGRIKGLSSGFATGSVSGSGLLAIINFTLISKHTTKIDINGPSVKYAGKSLLQDSNGYEIAHEDSDGIVSDQPPPVPQIWEQLWFQVLLAIIAVVVIIAVYFKFRKPPPAEEEIQPVPEEEPRAQYHPQH